MILTIKDRIVFFNLFPREANIVDQLVIQDINDKIKLSPDEREKINFRVENNQAAWSNNKLKDMDVKFLNPELTLLKSFVEKLDKEKKITMEILDLCLKIREEKNG